MNYEEMSDLEINQSVTGLIFDCEEWALTQCGKYFYHCGVDGGAYVDREVVDYCNSPSDAWPIVYKNRINLISPVETREAWVASHTRGGGNWSVNDLSVVDKNPFRAAMIVFLMMRDDQCQKP